MLCWQAVLQIGKVCLLRGRCNEGMHSTGYEGPTSSSQQRTDWLKRGHAGHFPDLQEEPS